MDLQATGMLCLGWLILCVADDAWTGIYSVVPGISSSCGGSIVFGVSSSVVSLLLVLMARSIYIIASGGITSMPGVTYMSSSSWVFCGFWFPLESTPVISASPIIWPLRSVNINCSGSHFASSFNRAMVVYGIGIESQILLVIFFAE